MTTHTPTPWKVTANGQIIREEGNWNVHICQVIGHNAHADAAFIVRAVNAHQLLLEVAKEVIAKAKDCSREGYKCLFCFAQEAIAKTEIR